MVYPSAIKRTRPSHESPVVFQAWSAKQNTSADQAQKAPETFETSKKIKTIVKQLWKQSRMDIRMETLSFGGSSSGTKG